MKVLLILNPICGFILVALFVSGYWFLFPIPILVVFLNLTFFFRINKYDHLRQEIKDKSTPDEYDVSEFLEKKLIVKNEY